MVDLATKKGSPCQKKKGVGGEIWGGGEFKRRKVTRILKQAFP